MGSGRSPKRRVRDDDFIVGYRRIIVGYPRIVFLLAEAFREYPLKSWASRFRGRRSIWWGWRVTLLAPRIGNDVSYVTQIIDDIHFAWQAQYLVRVPGWFCLLRALEMMIHMWRRSLMTFIWCGWRSIWWSWRVTWLAPRIGNDVSYVTQTTDDIDFAWQVQYLVRLEGHFVWQAQYLLRLACDFSWQAQHFVTFWEIAFFWAAFLFTTKLWHAKKKTALACWSKLRGVKLVRQRKVSCFECDGERSMRLDGQRKVVVWVYTLDYHKDLVSLFECDWCVKK